MDSPRPYQKKREAHRFQLARVAHFLSGHVWKRKVDKVGRISLYNWGYGVGRDYARREVYVRLDPDTIAWVIMDDGGQELIRHDAKEICP